MNYSEKIDQLRSILHGANIQRGQNDLEKEVLNFLAKCGEDVEKGRKINIEHKTQKTYKPDIILRKKGVVYLIDTKSDGYNNNTPVSDTVEKYCAAKNTMKKETGNDVKFIFLSFFLKTKDLGHLHKEYSKFGLDYVEGNGWLKELTGVEVAIESRLAETHQKNIDKRIKEEIGTEGIEILISYLKGLSSQNSEHI
jgi:hypothetical protein